MRPGVGLLLAGLCACGRPDAPPAETVSVAPPVPDTLVLTTPDGFEVWLTDLREARDSTGTPCQERSVEIRRDTTRLRVPLLYVRTPPTRLDADHVQAELSRDCRTMALYRVELRTARPYKLADR